MAHLQVRPDTILIGRPGAWSRVPGACFPTASRVIARRCRRLILATALGITASVSIGCSSSDNPVAPSGSAIATIRVVTEAYRVLLTTPAQIAAARAAQAGGRAAIPNGRLVAGAQINTGYTWHVEDVEFVEATIELCDGLPSHVQRDGVAFGGGRYCPWSARVVDVQVHRQP
jgi:hypothetical protein